jgi:Ni/Co efflux regulator RcnB
MRGVLITHAYSFHTALLSVGFRAVAIRRCFPILQLRIRVGHGTPCSYQKKERIMSKRLNQWGRQVVPVAICAGLALSTPALADDNHHDDHHPGHDNDHHPGPPQGGPHHGPPPSHHAPPPHVVVNNDHRTVVVNHHTTVVRNYGPHPNGPRWVKGDYLPTEYRNHTYVVENYRDYHLAPPPRGYYWVNTGPDFVLAAVATGLVASVVLNN